MTTTKVNIGIALAQNFNKVTLEFVDEPIEYDMECELYVDIRSKFKLILDEVEKVHKELKDRKERELM